MTENPYEAPRTAEPQVARDRGLAGGTGTFDIGRCLSEMWEVGKAHVGLLVGGFLLGIVLYYASFLTIVGIFLLVPVFLWGGVKLGLNMVDGGAAIGDLFSGFKRYGQALGSMLVLFLLMLVLGLLASSVQLIGTFLEEPALIGIGALISMALQFTVLIRFVLAPLYVVDQDLGGVDAMKASWNALRGQVLKVIALAILSYLVTLAGMMALVLPMFWTAPMSYLLFVSAYRQIVGRPGGRSDDGDEAFAS